MDAMREAFEAWARLNLDPYDGQAKDNAWLGWQAATKVERERAERIIDGMMAQMDCDEETEEDLVAAIRDQQLP